MDLHSIVVLSDCSQYHRFFRHNWEERICLTGVISMGLMSNICVALYCIFLFLLLKKRCCGMFLSAVLFCCYAAVVIGSKVVS